MGPKILFSSALIAAGTALVTGGPTAFATVFSLIWRYVHLVLFAAAGVLVLAAVVPRRALVLPAVLASLGLVVLLVRSYGLGPVARFGGGGALAAVGIMLAMHPSRPPSLHRRRWALIHDRKLAPTKAPARIRLVAAGGRRLTVDLAGAAHQNELIQLFLSTWYGEINLNLPEKWIVVAGRVAAARSVTFAGRIDWAHGFEDPDRRDKAALKRLLGEERTSADRRLCIAVVHVLGVGGRVNVARENC